MTIYVVTYKTDNGACGDPECCGDYQEYKNLSYAYKTKEQAEAYIKAQSNTADIYGYEIEEVELVD